MSTAEKNHLGLQADPDAAWLAQALASASASASASALDRGGGRAGGASRSEGTEDGEAIENLVQRLTRAEDRAKRLLRINKRLNTEHRLPRLLESIMDTVLDLTDGERGFVLLRDVHGELAVKVARNIAEGGLEGEDLAFSRSIATKVAESGQPIITVDAAGDDRFREALSVNAMGLRSVMAVPLVVKGEAVGTIYVDNRLRKGVFDDNDVHVLLDFADQAAIAINNARLLTELHKRERQIETLNQRLNDELAARKDEISSMKIELSENREALAVRYDYGSIVGKSPRMLDLFRLLDRVTDTNLPVVILGESGTGKELVARAIHANGPRKDQPFVSENCAAIAETLLESTLFGYVKGAFTGADRDTRGLFAIADGGTLFLDEVAEMSAALQGKLLRVLQDGEYRRVGGQRSERTSVRVVAATNRDLERMVAEGKFRQDLYYRLAVVSVSLPPLRERREDIPLLIQHFLRHTSKRNPASATDIQPEAVAKLCAYRWPGNVRELQNEIERAAAFARGAITTADLSPQIASEDGLPIGPDPDDLTLKPRVERMERALIREAMARHDGNQTRAADALGVSRFGLQKKLKRYGMG